MASYIGSTGLTYLWNKIKAVFATKQDTLVSGTNIKTINSQSLLGSGNISISGAPAIIEMRAINNSGNLENLSFVDAGEAYDIVVANGDNVVVRIDVGYMEDNEPTYYGEYTYMDLSNYYHGEGEYYLDFSYSDNLSLYSLYLSNDYEGGTDTLVIQGYDTDGFPEEIEIDENINATTQPFQYNFSNRYDAYYSYIGRNGNVKFVVKRGTRNAQNLFVPNGDTYPLEITYTGETDDKIVCSTYSSEKKLTFVFGIDSTNNQLTIDAINTETIPTESTVSGWGFTKNAGTITGVSVAGVSKGTSGVVDVGISEVNHGTSDTAFTLTQNVMHIWGTVSSLTLSLPTDSNSYLDEFMFTFTSGSTPTTLSLPSTVKWVQDIEVEANKTYQVSIINNLAGWLTNGMPSGGGSGGGGENNVIESISVNNVAQTVTNKNVNITVPTKVSDLTNDSGFTSNTGTITSVKMNGSTVSSSGEADLGTVITSETSLSKGSTSGSGNAVTDLSVSGHTITLTKGKTFLESESDPIFAASAAYGISSSDITNWNGKTSNVGTITGITMNNVSKGTSGVVDLGTVITSETTLSKGTTTGSGNAVTDISVSGHTITLTKGTTFLTTSDVVTIYSGSSAPSSGTGSNGDIYIQTS